MNTSETMVSETRGFIPILIFLGLYCTDSIWFYHSRPLGQSNSVGRQQLQSMATMQATEAGGMLKLTTENLQNNQTFGNCTKDEMTETTVLKNPLKSPVFFVEI